MPGVRYTDLPGVKPMGLFDRTDLARAREVIGNTVCIAGNMPIALLHVGTKEEIRDYTRNLIEVVGREGPVQGRKVLTARHLCALTPERITGIFRENPAGEKGNAVWLVGQKYSREPCFFQADTL